MMTMRGGGVANGSQVQCKQGLQLRESVATAERDLCRSLGVLETMGG